MCYLRLINGKHITAISLNLNKILYLYMGLLYIYGKRRLRQIDSRCRHLMRRMDLAEIVDSSQQQHLEKVFFGAWVTLYNLDDETEHVYRIVGKDELAPSKGYISWISPLGKAMLGRTIGDTVRLTSPKGDESFEVIDIRYKDPDLKP